MNPRNVCHGFLAEFYGFLCVMNHPGRTLHPASFLEVRLSSIIHKLNLNVHVRWRTEKLRWGGEASAQFITLLIRGLCIGISCSERVLKKRTNAYCGLLFRCIFIGITCEVKHSRGLLVWTVCNCFLIMRNKV